MRSPSTSFEEVESSFKMRGEQFDGAAGGGKAQ